MIRTLLFSTLYPGSVRPSHGIFVAALTKLLDAHQTLGGAYLDQWRRLITIEALLRKVGADGTA